MAVEFRPVAVDFDAEAKPHFVSDQEWLLSPHRRRGSHL